MFTIISRRVITHSSLRRHFAKAAVVPSDEVIAQQAHLRPIREIAETILSDEDLERLEPYGKYKAKIPIDLLDKLQDKKDGKLILVTALTPTASGEGKTCTSVGLVDGLRKIGKRATVSLR